MSDNYVFNTGIRKHIRSNLSGIGAFFFVVHILCTYCNIRSLTCLHYRDDIDSRYAEDNVRLIRSNQRF